MPKGEESSGALESIVAWYGPKTGAFADLLHAMQQHCSARLGSSFEPYPLDCVHATLLDISKNARGQNLVFARTHPSIAPARSSDLESWLTAELAQPLAIRFGGRRADDEELESRGQPRTERRFSIQGPKAVLIGWSDAQQQRLGSIRRACEGFGFRHRYHDDNAVDDNDCYLRLGLLNTEDTAPDELLEAARHIRSKLNGLECTMEMSARDLKVVRYVDERLPKDTTHARMLDASS